MTAMSPANVLAAELAGGACYAWPLLAHGELRAEVMARHNFSPQLTKDASPLCSKSRSIAHQKRLALENLANTAKHLTKSSLTRSLLFHVSPRCGLPLAPAYHSQITAIHKSVQFVVKWTKETVHPKNEIVQVRLSAIRRRQIKDRNRNSEYAACR